MVAVIEIEVGPAAAGATAQVIGFGVGGVLSSVADEAVEYAVSLWWTRSRAFTW